MELQGLKVFKETPGLLVLKVLQEQVLQALRALQALQALKVLQALPGPGLQAPKVLQELLDPQGPPDPRERELPALTERLERLVLRGQRVLLVHKALQEPELPAQQELQVLQARLEP